jgi:hypothetical protein
MTEMSLERAAEIYRQQDELRAYEKRWREEHPDEVFADGTNCRLCNRPVRLDDLLAHEATHEEWDALRKQQPSLFELIDAAHAGHVHSPAPCACQECVCPNTTHCRDWPQCVPCMMADLRDRDHPGPSRRYPKDDPTTREVIERLTHHPNQAVSRAAQDLGNAIALWDDEP